MTPRRSYIICATPRCGSTLLCSLLRSSKVAGRPESWFRLANRPAWAAEWGIADSAGRFLWPDYLRAAATAGTTANGTFGLRLMWNMLSELATELGGAAPRDQAALLSRTFGPLHFLHLTRDDLVAQAVSRHKAEVSGTWHIGLEEADRPVVPHYDPAAIAFYLAEAEADNLAWNTWFAANGVTPLRLRYEALSADPFGTTLNVLDHLGLPTGLALSATNVRMADAVSAAWSARFRSETAIV